MIGLRVTNDEQEQPYDGSNKMAVQEIPLNKIALSKNSRLSISDGDLSELMASIKQQGLLQPIGVTKQGTGYRVVYGNRRFLACDKLGWSKIPAIVCSSKDKHDDDIKNLTENIQRRNISLAEAGRYISMLNSNGLTTKECAARLGLSENYIKSCLKAFQDVPKEYRDDLEVRVSAKKPSPGKIPISTARAILSAQTTHRLSADKTKRLFKAAKESNKFAPENVRKYASALKAGKENFLDVVEPIRRVVVVFEMAEKDYDRLHQQYISDGPFRSMNALMVAVLSGKKALRVKVAGGIKSKFEVEMGEKKYLSFDDIAKMFGWSKSMLYKRTKDLDAALIKINGRAIKPYRFDAEALQRLITAGSEPKPSRSLKIKNQKIPKGRPTLKVVEDDSWL